MKSFSEEEKRYIRIGYYRKNEIGMNEELFDSLPKGELDRLMENGKRRLTLVERIQNNIGGIIFGSIILAAIAYTVISLQVMTADYNRITKVEACELLKNLEIPSNILPNQSVKVEETNNSLGAASDCWIRVKSGEIEIVAVAYIATGYTKQYTHTDSRPGEWRGTVAQEFVFEDNFYRGTVTTYKTQPKDSELTNDLLVAERRLSNAVGEEIVSSLPKNEQIDEVRRGFVWGWLIPTFFDTEVQGSLPDAPEDDR
jgi:hypothetical protein